MADRPEGRREGYVGQAIRTSIATVLAVVGVLFLALSAGTAAYASWSEWQHQRRAVAAPDETLPDRLASVPTPAPSPTGGVVIVPARTPTPTASPRPSMSTTPVPTPTPRPEYGPATAMQIPKIGVKGNIMEVGVKSGEFEVPAWDIGHHEGSADPGEPGNAVFNGHLQTIDAGRVFARLDELEPGDAVYVYTARYRLDWTVESATALPTSDQSFIRSTGDVRLTLYTCTGTWNPLTRDYDHRQVVVARLVSASPR